MMPVNSVANGIFRIAIVCSLCCLGLSRMSQRISISNYGKLKPSEMISSSISSSISSRNGEVKSSHVELKDGKISVMEYESDDLSGKKKQTVLIDDEKKEFNDFVLTSGQQVPNKYFCNETSYSKICASINPNSYEINISDKNLDDNLKISTISPNMKNKEAHYQDETKKKVVLKSINSETSPELVTALKLELKNFENQQKIQSADSTKQEKIKNINDHLEKEKVNTLDNIKLLLSLFENQELNNKLSQVNTFNLDKEKMLFEYSEIKKKYNESLESLFTCENRVETLNNQMANLKLLIEKSADNKQLKNKNINNMNQSEDLETNIETTDGPKSDKCEDLEDKHSVKLLELQDEISKLKNTNDICMNEQSRLKIKLKHAKPSKLWKDFF